MSDLVGLSRAVRSVNRLLHEGARVVAEGGEDPSALSASLLTAWSRCTAALARGNPLEIAHAEAEANAALGATVKRLATATNAALRRDEGR